MEKAVIVGAISKYCVLITVTMSKLRKANAVHCTLRCTGLLSAEWSLNQVTSKQQHFCHLSKLHHTESPNTT